MNLYWPIYQIIEKEVLALAESIHFSDDQIQVYSIQIADLIVRCAIEIEALSKDIYISLGGNGNPTDDEGKERVLYFDTDCMKLINSKWSLDKKQIKVVAPIMYFEEHKVLTPLKGTHIRSKSKWNKAYQALKHDRYANLKQATIKNLLDALGALYILNVYYRNETIRVGRMKEDELEFANELGSSVFEVCYYQAQLIDWNHESGPVLQTVENNLQETIYVIKYSDKSYEEMFHCWCMDKRWERKNLEASDKVKIYLQDHPKDRDNSTLEICIAADHGKEELYKQVSFDQFVASSFDEVIIEAELNKGQQIYHQMEKPTEEEIDKELDLHWTNALTRIKYKPKKLW